MEVSTEIPMCRNESYVLKRYCARPAYRTIWFCRAKYHRKRIVITNCLKYIRQMENNIMKKTAIITPSISCSKPIVPAIRLPPMVSEWLFATVLICD
jgi:hypothetical protein